MMMENDSVETLKQCFMAWIERNEEIDKRDNELVKAYS